MLTKDEILKAVDLKVKKVDVPEWGGCVYVKTMTGTERDDFEACLIKGRKVSTENIRAKLCVRVIVNKDGERIFADEDVEAIGNKSAKALDRIYGIAAEMNGLSPEDVRDMVKNSDADLSEDSTSD